MTCESFVLAKDDIQSRKITEEKDARWMRINNSMRDLESERNTSGPTAIASKAIRLDLDWRGGGAYLSNQHIPSP